MFTRLDLLPGRLVPIMKTQSPIGYPMITKSDRITLQKAGFDNPDEPAVTDGLLAALAAMHRSAQDEEDDYDHEHPLSEQEKQLLKSGGATGLDGERPAVMQESTKSYFKSFLDIIQTSYSPEQLLAESGVAPDIMSALVDQGQVLVIKTPEGDRYPRLQFHRSSGGILPIPGLSLILNEMNWQIDAVSLNEFLKRPCQDLEDPDTGVALSPRTWLLKGNNPEEVAQLLRAL